MKTRVFHLAGAMVFASTSPQVSAQAIDMSGAHGITLSEPATASPATAGPATPQHALTPVWTRMRVQPGPDGQLRATCAVEPSPLVAHKPRQPHTDTLPTQQ